MTPLPALALHVATAVEVHARACRSNGVDLPPELVDVAKWAWNIARSDCGRLEASSLAKWVDRVHAAPMTPLLHTVVDAAKALALSPRQVQRLIATGAIPSVTVGTARRIRHEDLTAFVDSLAGYSFRERIEAKVAAVSPPRGPVDRREVEAGPGGDPTAAPASRQGAA